MIDIKDKKDCCGCSACANICSHNAITMNEDDEGFKYPVVSDLLCTKCDMCDSVCPIIYRKTKKKESYKSLYAVRHKNNDVLMSSSSGGAFSALAECILALGGVVIGAAYNERMEVTHIFVNNKNELDKLRGSKYVQSNLGTVYSSTKSLLKRGIVVLFTGTPCQVEGLKMYLHKPFPNLYTMDLVCHAVPSPMIFRDYVNYINKRMSNKLIYIGMRDKKSCGWSHSYSYRYIFCDGKNSCDVPKFMNWGRLYFSQLISRPSCNHCMFTNFDRPGDITVADFWDDKHRRPDLYSRKGTSLFIVNSEAGQRLANLIKETGNMDFWEITEEEAWQPCLSIPTRPSDKRQEFWDYYNKNGFEKAYKRYFDDSIYVKTKKIVKRVIKKLIS